MKALLLRGRQEPQVGSMSVSRVFREKMEGHFFDVFQYVLKKANGNPQHFSNRQLQNITN